MGCFNPHPPSRAGDPTAQAQQLGQGGVPFRYAQGTVNVTVSGAGGTASVTFPASRFTVAPMIQVTKSSAAAAKYVPYYTSVTASGCTVGLYAGDGSSASVTQPVTWTAMQMLSGAAAG